MPMDCAKPGRAGSQSPTAKRLVYRRADASLIPVRPLRSAIEVISLGRGGAAWHGSARLPDGQFRQSDLAVARADRMAYRVFYYVA